MPFTYKPRSRMTQKDSDDLKTRISVNQIFRHPIFRFLWYSELFRVFRPCGPEGNRTPYSSMPWKHVTGIPRARSSIIPKHKYLKTQKPPSQGDRCGSPRAGRKYWEQVYL